jgi:hypothetical protein
MKATVIRWKDEDNHYCYNVLGDRFALPENLETTETPFYAIIGDEVKTIAIMEEVAPEEMMEYTVEVPTIVEAFKNKEDLIAKVAKAQIETINTLRVRG